MADLPDVVLSPDAVLGDDSAAWRHGRAPDYSKTRKFFAESTCLVFPLPQHVSDLRIPSKAVR